MNKAVQILGRSCMFAIDSSSHFKGYGCFRKYIGLVLDSINWNYSAVLLQQSLFVM